MSILDNLNKLLRVTVADFQESGFAVYAYHLEYGTRGNIWQIEALQCLGCQVVMIQSGAYYGIASWVFLVCDA